MRPHLNVAYTHFDIILSLHHQNNRLENIYIFICPSSNQQQPPPQKKRKLILDRKIVEGYLSSPLHPPRYAC